MSFHFYLFDVNHGQSAAIRLPNGQWCIFDVGCCSELSPVSYIMEIERRQNAVAMSLLGGNLRSFSLLKATISHLHGDHLADYQNLLHALPNFLRTVEYDQEYLIDAYASSARESWNAIKGFCSEHASGYKTLGTAEYGVATIGEKWLSVGVARAIGGSANSRVNNASIVTRIDCYGNSILLCGDMESEAWDFVLNTAVDKPYWRAMVSNIDILVAPHHGHSAGYSVDLINLAAPSAVIISVESGDENVDSRYSSNAVKGILFNGTPYKSITTRLKGTIHLEIKPPAIPGTKGLRTWYGL